MHINIYVHVFLCTCENLSIEIAYCFKYRYHRIPVVFLTFVGLKSKENRTHSAFDN